MAQTSNASLFHRPIRRPIGRPIRRPSRRVGGTVAGFAIAAVLAGCSTPYASQQPGKATGTGGSPAHEVILVCESGTVTDANGVETSSAVATRVPAGTPVPPGCHLG